MANTSSLMRQLSLKVGVAVAVAGSLLVAGSPSQAADRVTIARMEHRSVPIEALKALAEDGEVDGYLYQVIDGIGETPETAQELLSTPMSYGLVPADKLFNSPEGEDFLSGLSQYIMPYDNDVAANQALRSAIISSLADDGTMTIVEILENYPVPVRIHMDELLTMSEHFTGLDSLISFISSSTALRVSESIETQYSSIMERRVTQTTRTTYSSPEPMAPAAPRPAPVRALW